MARWRAVSIAVALTMGSSLSLAEKPALVERLAPGEAAASPAPDALRKELRLPGLVINLEERCVDVESSVCLHEGTLELVACTKDSKEHESIVRAIEAGDPARARQAAARHMDNAIRRIGQADPAFWEQQGVQLATPLLKPPPA